MYFPKYWAKGSHRGQTRDGREVAIEAFGWSSESVAAARAHGNERARKVIESGFGADKGGHYEYGNAPFREEVTDTLQVDGADAAIISRNRYGALVLNSAQVMFVDIDFPEDGGGGFVNSLLMAFSAKRRQARAEAREQQAVAAVEAWARRNPRKTLRLYRTHSGLRVILTDGLHDPKSAETKTILEELKADPLYRSLTERQECFRARLTPKPWRCESPNPPGSFPWADSAHENRYREWENQYAGNCRRFSTCRLVSEIGVPAAHPVIQAVLTAHDSACLNGDRPLA